AEAVPVCRNRLAAKRGREVIRSQGWRPKIRLLMHALQLDHQILPGFGGDLEANVLGRLIVDVGVKWRIDPAAVVIAANDQACRKHARGDWDVDRSVTDPVSPAMLGRRDAGAAFYFKLVEIGIVRENT